MHLKRLRVEFRKYTSRSEEINLLTVPEIGVGSRGTLYAFDYVYCLTHNIPTHTRKDSGRINPARTLKSGEWIQKVTNISNEIIAQTNIRSKIDGIIQWITEAKDGGSIRGVDGNDYFFSSQYIIESNKQEILHIDHAVRFLPVIVADSKAATEIEII